MLARRHPHGRRRNNRYRMRGQPWQCLRPRFNLPQRQFSCAVSRRRTLNCHNARATDSSGPRLIRPISAGHAARCPPAPGVLVNPSRFSSRLRPTPLVTGAGVGFAIAMRSIQCFAPPGPAVGADDGAAPNLSRLHRCVSGARAPRSQAGRVLARHALCPGRGGLVCRPCGGTSPRKAHSLFTASSPDAHRRAAGDQPLSRQPDHRRRVKRRRQGNAGHDAPTSPAAKVGVLAPCTGCGGG